MAVAPIAFEGSTLRETLSASAVKLELRAALEAAFPAAALKFDEIYRAVYGRDGSSFEYLGVHARKRRRVAWRRCSRWHPSASAGWPAFCRGATRRRMRSSATCKSSRRISSNSIRSSSRRPMLQAAPWEDDLAAEHYHRSLRGDVRPQHCADGFAQHPRRGGAVSRPRRHPALTMSVPESREATRSRSHG
jgi:hypothetical protein